MFSDASLGRYSLSNCAQRFTKATNTVVAVLHAMLKTIFSRAPASFCWPCMQSITAKHCNTPWIGTLTLTDILVCGGLCCRECGNVHRLICLRGAHLGNYIKLRGQLQLSDAQFREGEREMVNSAHPGQIQSKPSDPSKKKGGGGTCCIVRIFHSFSGRDNPK